MYEWDLNKNIIQCMQKKVFIPNSQSTVAKQAVVGGPLANESVQIVILHGCKCKTASFMDAKMSEAFLAG